MKRHYYLEADGQIYLRRAGKTLRFPNRLSELPCKFTPIYTMRFRGDEVVYAKPILARHPRAWFPKDDIPLRMDAAPIVHLAVNRTHLRGAAKVILCERGKVLMVNASRGLTRGIWNLPGGFIGYTESPAEAVRREVKEELGIPIRVRRLVGVYTQTFGHSAWHMISFVFEGERAGKGSARPAGLDGIRPDPDEIGSVRWFPISQAMRRTRNPFAAQGLRDYLAARDGLSVGASRRD